VGHEDGHFVHNVVVDGVHVLGHVDDDVLAETNRVVQINISQI